VPNANENNALDIILVLCRTVCIDVDFFSPELFPQDSSYSLATIFYNKSTFPFSKSLWESMTESIQYPYVPAHAGPYPGASSAYMNEFFALLFFMPFKFVVYM
jgi:hypothetical protein